MKKCYVAGKIGKLPEAEWQANFETARQEVWAMDMMAVCPTQLPHNHGRTWKDYMVEDLAALMTCDYVYAQRNWQDSKGARLEV